MDEKNTDELKNVLRKTHISEFDRFRKDNKDSLINDRSAFGEYLKNLIKDKGITQQKVFIEADITERYGYKLLSGEKVTKQRDIILRICYAARLTLDETQRALEKYEMPILYPKIPRDALLMLIFEERPGDIIEINTLLTKNGFAPLRTSGLQS